MIIVNSNKSELTPFSDAGMGIRGINLGVADVISPVQKSFNLHVNSLSVGMRGQK